jgi:hypothetical protein
MRNFANIAILVGAVAGTLASGCGPATRNGNGGDDGSGNDAGGGSGDGGGSNMDGCSDAAKFVYTVDENNTFSKFDPGTKTFTDIGNLSCPASGGATPFSMGVDRTATAWVLYNHGELFHVDTTSLACTKTTWSAQLGLMQFGMGFSTDTAGGTTDTLFVGGGAMVDTGSSKLAKLDTGSLTASAVGTITGWPELTGTGSAELWGFFPDPTTPKVEKIDKTSGSAITTFMLGSLAGTPSAWAFAFWGGDYWIFLMKDFDLSTNVYQIDGTNGMIKGTTATSGRTIVGAGVSTCAPVIIQ